MIGYAIKYTIGWRVTDEEEVEGIDFAQHGETAYDLHTSGVGGGKGVLRPRPRPLAVTEGANA